MVKKMMSSFLAFALVLSCFAGAGALEVMPRSIMVDTDISTTATSYTTDPFTCIIENGNSLRYWFSNSGSSSCTVKLMKKGLWGYTEVSSMTISSGSNSSEVYAKPNNGTFKITVTSSGGIGSGVNGTLRVNQLDL